MTPLRTNFVISGLSEDSLTFPLHFNIHYSIKTLTFTTKNWLKKASIENWKMNKFWSNFSFKRNALLNCCHFQTRNSLIFIFILDTWNMRPLYNLRRNGTKSRNVMHLVIAKLHITSKVEKYHKSNRYWLQIADVERIILALKEK